MASRQLTDPRNSKFDLVRARELLRLGRVARDRFKEFKKDKDENSLQKRFSIKSDKPDESYVEYTVEKDIFFSQKVFFSRKQVIFGFIARKGNEFFIIFRGSQTMGDWFSNARFYQSFKSLKVAIPRDNNYTTIPGKIHKGFLEQYTRPEPKFEEGQRSISETIRTALSDSKYDEKSSIIYIAGHSLGGALATLAAAELSIVYKEAEIFLYTTASPRVGNQDFEDFFDKENKSESRSGKKVKAFRIFNSVDAVPNLPPRFESPREAHKYVHVGEPFSFNNNVIGLLPTRLEYQHTLPIYACALGLNPNDFKYSKRELPFNC